MKKQKKQKTYEELIQEYDDDELWEMYMSEHLKQERKAKKEKTKNKK